MIRSPRLRLTRRVTREQIERWATDPDRECVWAVHTPWWSLWEEAWLPYRKGVIPCDPRGSMLFQGQLAKFWASALADPAHYGKHGIDALVAAFHSNVEIKTTDGRGWKPTSLNSWDAYNRLLDDAA